LIASLEAINDRN